MEGLTIIKFGGSIITEKDRERTANLQAMKNLVSDLGQYLQEVDDKVIVVSGGGSFPHPVAKRCHLKNGINNSHKFGLDFPEALFGLAHCAHEASAINHILWQQFLDAKLPAMSFRPSSIMFSQDGELLSFYLEPLEQLLELGIIPLLYGDVIYDMNNGNAIASGEKIIKGLCEQLPTKRVIMCANVDGLFTKNPQKYDDGEFIEVYSEEAGKKVAFEGMDTVMDATGGMALKVKSMVDLAQLGIEGVICNGGIKGNLYQALKGEKIGTVFPAQEF